jgi:hypothetical protein
VYTSKGYRGFESLPLRQVKVKKHQNAVNQIFTAFFVFYKSQNKPNNRLLLVTCG